MTLDQILTQAYQAQVQNQGSIASCMDAFKAECAADPEFEARARQKLQAVKDIDPQRCFVSGVMREFLIKALG